MYFRTTLVGIPPFESGHKNIIISKERPANILKGYKENYFNLEWVAGV